MALGVSGRMDGDMTASKGTFNVRLGESLASRDASFHSLRYNFAPDSLDKSHGALDVSSNGEVTLSYASSSKDKDEHLFKGPVAPCKENDFLLVYDPDTKEFVLEKLSSVVALRNIRNPKRRAPQTDLHDDEDSQARPSQGRIAVPSLNPLEAMASKQHESEDTFSDLEESLLQDLEGSADPKTEVCNFSGAKIYPGRGKLVVRSDSKAFRLLNGKCAAHFLSKKNPRKFHWTVFFRRLHKKGNSEEVAKKRTRKVVKVQRPVVGATWEQIVAQREQPVAVRKAMRDAATQAAKEQKKSEQAKKRAEKIKAVGSAQRQQQPKVKASKGHAARPAATSR